MAWLAVLPTALVAVLAIALLGPPLGNALLAPPRLQFWVPFQIEVRPEPVEQGRFLIALAAPLLLAALTVVGVRRLRWHGSLAVDATIVAIQLLGIAGIVVCVLRVKELLGTLYPPTPLTPIPIDYFSSATLLAAAVGTVAVVGGVRSEQLRSRLASWTRETRVRSVAAGLVALVAIVVWLLHGAYTEDTIARAYREVWFHIQFTMDETYAVLDGRSPLVDFAAQYGSLWAYVFAAAMWLVGDSVGTWIALALLTTGLGMLAIYATLRRVAGSSLRGLLLFLPVLAASFFKVGGTLEDRYTFGNYFGTFPMRYAGPSLLAWLVARQLAGDRPRRPWLLFVVAGLVVLNNADVGIAAVGATAAALLWSGGRPTRASAGRLALEALAGLAAAFALVSLLTLVRAGALPDLGLLLRFSKIFGSAGFGLYPMPTIGLHLVLYVTFVAAIGVATVRALRADADRLLTGMLAWSGVFGLGAGTYYVGRSTPDDLIAIFFPWSFALALLLIPALRSLAGASWRRPPLAAAACVFGFLALACTLAQTPTPWEQLDRLDRKAPAILAAPLGQRFVAEHVQRGEPVAILLLLGHRIGVNVGVDNVSPYANSVSMPTVEQLDEAIVALREAGGSKLFVRPSYTTKEMQQALVNAGFTTVDADARGFTALWVDGAQ
jgi:hypothetical protein